MRDKFHGYYRPTPDEFAELWGNATIAFDANAILNLYRLSPSSRDQFLRLLEILKERIWLTFQVAEEYHRNRCNRIADQSPKYDIAKTKLTQAVHTLQEGKQHPWIDASLQRQFEEVASDVIVALKLGKGRHVDLMLNDPIRDRIGEIFDGRIGECLSEKDLEEAYAEAKKRYAKKIPPGYEDTDKPEPNCYGDYVIWKELIKFATKNKSSMILVTDDAKEDWWLIAKDDKGGNKKTVGPRPELRQEFMAKTEHDIYLYSSDGFLEAARDHGYDKDVSKATVDEVKEAAVSRYNEEVEAIWRRPMSYGDAVETAQRRSFADAIRSATLGPSPPLNGPIGKLTSPLENNKVGEFMIYAGDPLEPTGDTIPVLNITSVTLTPDWLLQAIKVQHFDTLVAHVVKPPPGFQWKGMVPPSDQPQ